MTKNKKTLVWLAVCIFATGVFGLAAAIAQPEEPTEMEKADTAESIHKCTIKCVKMCQKNMGDMASIQASLDAALIALDSGNSEMAKTEINKAKDMLASVRTSMDKCMQQMPCANKQCPISGKEIDITNRPASQTRMYKGKKIGFCCDACPAKWDSLSDLEKDAKLDAVMLKETGKKMMEKTGEIMRQGKKRGGLYE